MYSSDHEKPLHEFAVESDYFIARYTVTNSQYAIYANDVGIFFSFPKGRELHPVVYVSWWDSLKYIQWLNKKFKKDLQPGYIFNLPSEPEWEKAARGVDGRIYPWGDSFDNVYSLGADLGRDRCNIDESGQGETVSVDQFSPIGDSPYGVSNMSGNVWEWTRSKWADSDETMPEYKYPYISNDGRENEDRSGLRILRGGSFFNSRWHARCAFRGWDRADIRYRYGGFRIVIVSS